MSTRTFTRAACLGLALTVAIGVCAGARPALGAVTSRQEERAGRPVHVLANEHVTVVVDPADGGRLDVGGAGGIQAGLFRDVFRGRACAYRIVDRSAAGSVAVLTLRWTHGSGLSVRKTVSLVASHQSARVTYYISNGSQTAARLHPEFTFEAPPGDEWQARVLSASGLSSPAGGALVHDTGSVYKHVPWFVAQTSSGHGVAVVVREPVLDELMVRSTVDTSGLEMTGATVVVPAGRALTLSFVCGPFAALGPVLAAREQLLCAMNAERAGSTLRLNLSVAPLLDLGFGTPALRLIETRSKRVKVIGAEAVELLCGTVHDFSFYRTDVPDGTYRVEFEAPALREAAPLASLTVSKTGVLLAPHVHLPVAPPDFEQVPGWTPVSRPGAREDDAAGFFGVDGSAPAALRLAVGLGETEALLVGVRTGPAAVAELELPQLGATQGGEALPAGSVRFLRVMGPPNPDSTDTPGLVAPAQGPPWQSGRLACIRFSIPRAASGLYTGRLQMTAPRRVASVPVELTVWPVRRPRPGLVKLLLLGAPVDVWEPPESHAAQYLSLTIHEVANLTVRASGLLNGRTVRARHRSGLEMPLAEWTRARADRRVPTELPWLDFSALSPAFEGALLAGLTDVVVVGDPTWESLAPPGTQESEQGAMGEWAWRELAIHLAMLGYGNLFFVAERPISDVSDEAGWWAVARGLRKAGWSFCGPYDGAALTPDDVPALCELGDLVLIKPAGEGGLDEALVRAAGTASLGVWAPGVPGNFSASRARAYARRLAAGVDAVAFGAVVGPVLGAEPEGRLPQALSGPDEARALDSLAWEGVRDGIDEANYARLLEWYRETAGGGGRSDASLDELPQRDLLQRTARAAEAVTGQQISLYWNDILLVERGTSRAVIALDPSFSSQRAQAALLNHAIFVRCGVTLPQVDLRSIDEPGYPDLVILFGTPETNPILQGLARTREDLTWRLARNGTLLVEMLERGRRYLALMAADQDRWGDPVVRFTRMLRQEGGWVEP